MQYRTDRKGTRLSVLGYGCLRFTKKNGKIDLTKQKLRSWKRSEAA